MFMKDQMKYMSVPLIMVAAMVLIGTLSSEAKLVPRVDNFIIVVDQSGSMFMTHQGKVKAKATVAKEIMSAMNERIPELGYTGTIQVFAPDKALIGPERYDKNSFRQTIETLPEKGRIFGNRTPLGDAIWQLAEVLGRHSGKTAVLIFSDGEKNIGKDVLEATKAIRSKHPNTSFYTISLADSEEGRITLKEISRSGGGFYAEGTTLHSDKMALDSFVNDVFYLVEMEEVVQFEETAMVEEVPAPEYISLNTVYFGFDKSDLEPEARTALEPSVELLRNRPELTVVIQGYTDQIGTEEYNRKLSERRAMAVYDYFRIKGIPASRMATAGYGEFRPVADDSTRAGRALNRRVDIPLVCTEKVQLASCIVWPKAPAS
jgi:OOP family OmpA-OmpF porin